jgi:hypothetical protein
MQAAIRLLARFSGVVQASLAASANCFSDHSLWVKYFNMFSTVSVLPTVVVLGVTVPSLASV